MRVALVTCPAWSVLCPPYNISLLKSIVLDAGHECKTFDFNVEAYQFFKGGDINYWEGQNFFYWEEPTFDSVMLPQLIDLINEWIDQLVSYEPDLIGFSLYHTSVRCATFMIMKIMEDYPDIKIAIGGPQCYSAEYNPMFKGLADYICVGEGEQAILDMLKFPSNQFVSSKLTKINNNPPANYDDYDTSKYLKSEAISLESSRGCVAKCSFCMETHYWAYRSKKGDVVVKEMIDAHEKYGFTLFRFNDSLVNGNLKEFRVMVDELNKSKYRGKLMWNGYARINGDMDAQFIKDIKTSGCEHLSFGIESGSQKVLNDMNKGITIDEINQNLIDCHKVDLPGHVNWIVGFPTETVLDHLHSLAFIFNHRNYMSGISPGMTCGVGERADLKINPGKYNIDPVFYWGAFVTNDLKNTPVHRGIRLICTHLFIDLFGIKNGQHHRNLINHYNLKRVNNEPIVDNIPLEELTDFSHFYDGSFESSLHCEYVTFFFILFKIYGEYEMELTFDEERDVNEFGKMICKPYNAIANFKAERDGHWNLKLTHNLKEHFVFDETVELGGKF